MVIFAGLAGICLWGLFNLLDNLKQPGLLRTQNSVAVKGCAALDAHKDSPRVCPQLLCQKTLIDRKLLGLDDRIEIVSDNSDQGGRIIDIRSITTDQHFACVVVGLVVKQADRVSATDVDSPNQE
jgi:hypothetical protein